MIEAVLFDLDGTLIDTAPDMGGALNNLLIEENLAHFRWISSVPTCPREAWYSLNWVFPSMLPKQKSSP